MNKVEKITEEIQKLENDYAEILAYGGNAKTLNFIWNQIKDLRDQLSILSATTSQGGRNISDAT